MAHAERIAETSEAVPVATYNDVDDALEQKMRQRSASSSSTTGLRLYWSLHLHVPRDRRPPRCGSIRLAFAGFGSEQFVLCGRARAAGKLHVYPTDMCNAWLIAEGRSLTLTGGPAGRGLTRR